MSSVREKEVYTNSQGEKTRNCEYRDSCDDATSDLHVREWRALATSVTLLSERSRTHQPLLSPIAVTKPAGSRFNDEMTLAMEPADRLSLDRK
jgi:hypothetical protein